ncbi:MAG: hypothetical protein WCT14_18160 [Treponemataceae bacterium]
MGLLQKAQKNDNTPTGTIEGSGRGFLEKAESLRASDEIVQLCIDRLKRLPSAPGTAYTALTVLKAYFPIIAEIILAYKAGEFRIQEAVGINDTECNNIVKLEALETKLSTDGYYVFPVSALHIDSLTGETLTFAFPIQNEIGSTIGQLLIIAQNADHAMLSSVRKIVNTCPNKFILAPEMITVKKNTLKTNLGISAEAASENGIQAIGESHILVFRFDASIADTERDTLGELARVRLGNSGVSFPVNNDLLVFFLKSKLDRELYANQLSKSLRNVFSLSADTLPLISQGYAVDKAQAIAIIRAQT